MAADAANPEASAGRKFTDTLKVVFSRTLSEAPWPNTTLAQDDLPAAIRRLKELPGHDLIAYGGAAFVGSLIEHDLIDDYHLLVNPVAIGRGLSIFGPRAAPLPLRLVEARAFACGIVAQHYQPRRG